MVGAPSLALAGALAPVGGVGAVLPPGLVPLVFEPLLPPPHAVSSAASSVAAAMDFRVEATGGQSCRVRVIGFFFMSMCQIVEIVRHRFNRGSGRIDAVRGGRDEGPSRAEGSCDYR